MGTQPGLLELFLSLNLRRKNDSTSQKKEMIGPDSCLYPVLNMIDPKQQVSTSVYIHAHVSYSSNSYIYAWSTLVLVIFYYFVIGSSSCFIIVICWYAPAKSPMGG